MLSRISSPKDFWTGLIYIAFGSAAAWFGSAYNMGTAGRMGPGYFPKVLAGILIILGVISLVRSFFTKGEPITRIAFKPLILLLLACGLFGLLINRAGLIIALAVLVLVSAAASKQFKFDKLALLGLIALIAFCSLVFVKGLGIPMPLIGTWLEPYAGPLATILR